MNLKVWYFKINFKYFWRKNRIKITNDIKSPCPKCISNKLHWNTIWKMLNLFRKVCSRLVQNENQKTRRCPKLPLLLNLIYLSFGEQISKWKKWQTTNAVGIWQILVKFHRGNSRESEQETKTVDNGCKTRITCEN